MTTHLTGGRALLRIPTRPTSLLIPIAVPVTAPAPEGHPDDKDVVFVHLRKANQYAVLYRQDYERVVAEIGKGRWMLNSFTQASGTHTSYVRAAVARRLVMIARIVANAPPRTAVRYRDGNSLNLRTENLVTDTAGGSGGCKKRPKGSVNALERRAKVREYRNAH